MKKRIVSSIPKYGDHGTGDVLSLQQALKGAAYDPGVLDDWFGDKTLKALKKFQKANGMPGSGVIPAGGGNTFKLLEISLDAGDEESAKPNPHDNYFGAPHVGVRVDLLGRKETDKDLSAWLVPEWKAEGLNYKDLIGSAHAHCSIAVNKQLRDVGLKGTNSAAASSHSGWGKKSPYWFGCTLPIKHKSGGRHVCLFLYWWDEAKKIAVTKDSNRSNTYGIFLTDLSGKGDTLVGGPRWSLQLADGWSPTKAQVLAKYPFLIPGSMGTGGTTK